jgi:alpha-tubulin suppressor-like RCC1 family protein
MAAAAAALSSLRAATGECAALAGRFSPEQYAKSAALANALRYLFTWSNVAAAATAVRDPDADAGRAPLLPHLPAELLLHILRHLDVRDLARLAGTCRQLYFGPPCPPRPTSVVEDELRRRAGEDGRWLPSSPPAGVSGWVPALLQREWRDSLHLSTVAAGVSPHSLFVDAHGALMVCGFEYHPGTLSLPRNEGDSEFEEDDEHEDEDEDFQLRTILVPTPVPSMASIRIRHEVAGVRCSLAVSQAGLVFSWGDGQASSSRLASVEQDRLVPTLIQELCHHRVRQVAMAHDLCAAVTEEGLLFTWATEKNKGTFLVKNDERVPRLGLGLEGTNINQLWPPQCVTALSKERVGSVAVGSSYTLVTTEAGAVFSFGTGARGRLGHGDNNSQVLPKRIEALDGVCVATVAVGMCHCLALTACGRVFWWGARIKSTTEFELQLLPQLMDSTAFGGGRVRRIAANIHTAYAVTDAGVLFTWGCDSYAHDGMFPLGHGHCQVQLSPWPVAGLHGIAVVGVSAGRRHALALAADGSVYAVGLGRALGIGWGLGGDLDPGNLEGDPADEAEGQMILAATGDRIQLTPKRVSGLVCSVPRAHRVNEEQRLMMARDIIQPAMEDEDEDEGEGASMRSPTGNAATSWLLRLRVQRRLQLL